MRCMASVGLGECRQADSRVISSRRLTGLSKLTIPARSKVGIMIQKRGCFCSLVGKQAARKPHA